MEEHVHLTGSGRREGGLEAPEELGTTAMADRAGPRRQVETEVRIGKEQEAHALTERMYRTGLTREESQRLTRCRPTLVLVRLASEELDRWWLRLGSQ